MLLCKEKRALLRHFVIPSSGELQDVNTSHLIFLYLFKANNVFVLASIAISANIELMMIKNKHLFAKTLNTHSTSRIYLNYIGNPLSSFHCDHRVSFTIH